MTIALSLRPTGNFWIDTGLVVLVRQFGEGERQIGEILDWLLKCLKTEEGGWIRPTNSFINTQAKPENLLRDFRKQPSRCDLCGEEGRTIDAKMWMYPFVVDPQKFGTFYPGTKRGLRVCGRCALAGLAAYLGWLWKAQGRDALHFFIFHAELQELERLHREILEPLRLKEEQGGTAPVDFAGPYIHETTFGLLLRLFRHVGASDQLSDEARQLLATLLGATEASPAPITLYAITGEPGQAFNMQALREFSQLHRLYRLYEQWLAVLRQATQEPAPHQRLVKVLSQFCQTQGQRVETLWRDRVCWAILEFGDPLPYVEGFLYEVQAKEEKKNRRPLVWGTIPILDHYIKEILGMSEQFQKILAGFGHELGAKAHEHNEMGLLYALRNAKNPEDFYRMLNDAQFRLGTTIPEALLKIEPGERIAGTPWVRVKTLLSIYAMNAYLYKEKPTKQES